MPDPSASAASRRDRRQVSIQPVESRWHRVRTPLLAVVALAFVAFSLPPYLTFAVTDTQYLFTFGAMLATGLIISELTARVRSHAPVPWQPRRRE